MSQPIVDRLEAINVKQDKGKASIVASTTSQFPIQEFRQIALVGNVCQSVDDDKAIDLFMVFCFGVAAGQKPINPITDAKIVAVLENGRFNGRVVDKGFVRALEIGDEIAVRTRFDACVPARDRRMMNRYAAVFIPAD